HRLRTAYSDSHTPFAVAVIRRGEGRNRVDHEQRRVAGGVDGLADFRDRREAAGRGFVVQDTYGLDCFFLVLAQVVLDHVRFGPDAPVGVDEFGTEPQLRRHVLPQRGELARLHHQDAIAG